MINTMIITALVAASLMFGTAAGWFLCALATIGIDCDHRMRICRLTSLVRDFLKMTEQYHDDPALANLRTYARDWLEVQD